METTPKMLVKQCRVCGDVALGFNFNGLSCESCKAFFRRNAVKNKIFKCRKNGSCFIDKKSRKFCKHCRLEKCIKIGMKKELISVNRDELQQTKKQQQPKTAEIQSQEQQSEERNKDKESPPLQPLPTSSGTRSDEEDDIHLERVHLQAYDLERLQEVHDAMLVFKDSMMVNPNNNCGTHACTSNGSSATGRNGILVHNSEQQQPEILLVVNNNSSPSNSSNSNSNSSSSFSISSSFSFSPTSTPNSNNSTTSSEVEVMSIAENYVSKILQFCKHFAAFRCLKLSDQVVLLKAFYPEIAAICAAFLYGSGSEKAGHKKIAAAPSAEDAGSAAAAGVTGLQALTRRLNETDNIFAKMTNRQQRQQNLPLPSELTQLPAGSNGAKAVIPIFRNFVTAMHVELENDVSIRNLIIAQLLFKTRENISCPEFMRYNQSIYCHLLRRYLEHKYQDSVKAEQKYSSVMCILSRISEVATIFREVYLNEDDIHKVGQVIVEIYNLF